MTHTPTPSFNPQDLELVDQTTSEETDDVELLFKLALKFNQSGQTEEARKSYLQILEQAPTHFGALNNLGALLMTTGFKTAARTAYAEAVKQHPNNVIGHINLANALAKNHETEAALEHFARALQLAPDHPKAHRGLSLLLSDLGDEKQAQIHRIKGFGDDPILRLPYYGKGQPLELVVLASAAGGTVPINHHLDNDIFRTSVIFVDFYDPKQPLPPHHLVFNAIGDADLCAQSLAAATHILSQTQTPIINQPSAVSKTGRAHNAERFAHIEGVITPKIKILPREVLEATDAPSLLSSYGFSFPILLRAPGFHTGRFFIRVENERDLVSSVSSMPRSELMVIEYLDARNPDQKIRKYRVMMIDGCIYPLHVAISHEWKIHYFSADMADNPGHRAEDAAFLKNMPQVLGAKAMRALEKIRDEMHLEYAGADFSLSSEGDVILFETNATMVVLPPDKDKKWDYRRPAVQHILDAIQQMLINRSPLK